MFVFTNPSAAVNDAFGIDNVAFVTTNPVPEPTTLALLGVGLVAARRRRRA